MKEGRKIKNIAIVGLGFMGGSLAKALRQKIPVTITAVEQDKNVIDKSIKEGTIQYGETDFNQTEWGIFDFIIFCTPVEPTIRMMKKLNGKINENCIVTDIGSTKSEIIETAKGINYEFIGGHPMVGSEKNGYDNAKAHLYENAYFVITPLITTSKAKIERLKELILSIGSIPVEVSPEKHDLVTAVISHVPHIVASALVNMVTEFSREDDIMYKLAAGGFKDITRIASSSPDLWKQISVSNQEKINIVLKKFILSISEYSKKLDDYNEEYIYKYFAGAKSTRDQFQEAISTDIPNQFSLIVDIEDIPGMIAKISNLLYEEGINIKNIGIIHNREFENGCLKIIFDKKHDQTLAFKILKNNFYQVYL